MSEMPETYEEAELRRMNQYVNNSTAFRNNITNEVNDIKATPDYQFRLKLKAKLKELGIDGENKVKLNGMPRNPSSFIAYNIKVHVMDNMFKYPEHFEKIIDNTANIIFSLYGQLTDTKKGNLKSADAVDFILSSINANFS